MTNTETLSNNPEDDERNEGPDFRLRPGERSLTPDCHEMLHDLGYANVEERTKLVRAYMRGVESQGPSAVAVSAPLESSKS